MVDMQGSGSEGPKEGSESMTSMVEVAISEHTDDAVEIHSSDQPEENASDDADDDDEEEFGDFSSNYVAPMVETATGPRLTHPSDVPHVTTDASLAGGQVVSAEDRSKASSPTVDLHQHLLHEATIAEHVLKQGKVYMMRLGGFPKKMMRKEVTCVEGRMCRLLRLPLTHLFCLGVGLAGGHVDGIDCTKGEWSNLRTEQDS